MESSSLDFDNLLKRLLGLVTDKQAGINARQGATRTQQPRQGGFQRREVLETAGVAVDATHSGSHLISDGASESATRRQMAA